MNDWVSTLLEVVGLLLITVAALMVDVRVGLFIGGVCAVGVGVLLDLGGVPQLRHRRPRGDG